MRSSGNEQYSAFTDGGIGAAERSDGDMHAREKCLTRRTTATVNDGIIYKREVMAVTWRL